MTNYSHGKLAEEAAVEYLQSQGYKIVDTNWKTRYCEIDIIAEKDKAVFFIEVKYRQSGVQGTGLDYVTPKKLKQMSFAAEMWVQNNNWDGPYQLAAIAIAGPNYEITDFLTEL